MHRAENMACFRGGMPASAECYESRGHGTPAPRVAATLAWGSQQLGAGPNLHDSAGSGPVLVSAGHLVQPQKDSDQPACEAASTHS